MVMCHDASQGGADIASCVTGPVRSGTAVVQVSEVLIIYMYVCKKYMYIVKSISLLSDE